MLTFLKLLESNEMSPVLEPKELPHFITKREFYSDDTIGRDFKILFDEKLSNRGNIVILLRNDDTSAVIGKRGIRPNDKKSGVFIFGQLEFKFPVNIHDTIIPKTNPRLLQVDGVEISSGMKTKGYGYLLYFTLIKSGYSIISDNVQYLGGQALWKKIAKESKFNIYRVYVLDNGTLRKDTNGKLVYYDGSNIKDSDLWSTNNDKIHTLFLATTTALPEGQL